MYQEPTFIKLSEDRVISLFGNIHEIHRLRDDNELTYWITTATEPYRLSEQEFTSLMAWATHPDRCVFVQSDEQIDAYQDYKNRGGFMQFDQWKETYQRHQRLVKELDAIEKPSQSLLDKVGQLEGQLLL